MLGGKRIYKKGVGVMYKSRTRARKLLREYLKVYSRIDMLIDSFYPLVPTRPVFFNDADRFILKDLQTKLDILDEEIHNLEIYLKKINY